MKQIIVCDIRNDEGLRFRKDKEILPCITEHIHKDGGGQYSCLIMEITEVSNNELIKAERESSYKKQF